MKIVQAIVQASKKLALSVRGLDLPAYLRTYYANVDGADLASFDPSDLAAAAVSQLIFARHRRGGALVRVFNPTLREHGFTSPHTIVEMVNDDMPFLVDSIGLALTRRSLTLHFLAHPIFAVIRDRKGTLRAIGERDQGLAGRDFHLESFQHVQVDRIVDPAQLKSIAHEIESGLSDVRVACADWKKMRLAARRTAEQLGSLNKRFDQESVDETRALLRWMENRHFTFLGYREYRLRGGSGKEHLESIASSGLGILRARYRSPKPAMRASSSDIRRQMRSRDLALVTKGNFLSTVHRAGYLDYVGIKIFDETGQLAGERRFLGLWTSAAYSANPRDIPLLRHKVAQIINHFALAADSHDGKALQHILESFPRDELFQASVPDLIRTVAGILGLQERPRVRLLVRRDGFHRFYSCLIFVPRDKYNTQVRQRIERVISEAFGALTLESQVQIAESNLARIHIVARTSTSDAPRVSLDALEKRVEAAVRSWTDAFKSALLTRFDEAYALDLFATYSSAFPAAYTEDFAADIGAQDVSFLESLEREPNRLHLDIYRSEARRKDKFFLKIFRRQDAIPISDLVPMIENMGLKVIAERPYELEFGAGRRAWIQDLELIIKSEALGNSPDQQREFKSALTAVWTGQMDNDGLNQLTLVAAMPWRMVTVIRAYCRYLLQAGLPFSAGYMAQVLCAHPAICRLMADLFTAKFDPGISAGERRRRLGRIDQRVRAGLENVTRSDEDRILRTLWHAMAATVRTNAYQPNSTGQLKDYVSFKIESQQLRELPLPKPLFEVFVSSPRMEGVHLRMGKVARGGIRWSDRREDFRTEVLGLMKAQQVKNTVILPVGAKGGFVVKRSDFSDRDAERAEVVACYQTLIRGMLDLTDNIVGDHIAGPDHVVRHDGDDPYLVVAADKGTATFSDIANAISQQYGFWLGDAFASGGSAGYDHKKMAITARGAWECVKRHFREMDVDIQKTPFTVAGIGDMAGDVFGNGLLQSPHIGLVAAFNHQDIFIDPEPDARRSFAERQRLYKMPRSSWQDYSKSLISKGGGIFSRSAKTLNLSREAQSLLGLAAQATPNEVIKAILKARVDLLWNGGIGTYVKASTETHADVGDRGNDAVRIDGRELNCKVIGEGGNLGLSQLGRVEFALRGGRLNTDFIDNSAGVNCSDVEVNLKILLNAAVAAKELTRAARDRLLARMTDEVAGLVLRNNYLQSQAISTAEFHAKPLLSESAYVIRAFERSGDLNRSLEFLPSDEELAERRKAGEGLTRPELATSLSYGKIWLYKALINSNVPEDPYLSAELNRYFPRPVQQRFANRIKHHRLRREIIATAITNSLINRMGPVFPVRAQDDTGADPAAIARAYTIAREVFAVRDLWAQIEVLDNRIPAAIQYTAMHSTTRLLRHMSYWLLENLRADLDIERAVRRYAQKVRELIDSLGSVLSPLEQTRLRAQRADLADQRVPEGLATRIASLELLHCALDLAEIATETRQTMLFTAKAYFNLGDRIGLTWIKEQVDTLAADGHWQEVARASLRDNLYALQRNITAAVLACRGRDAIARADHWMNLHATPLDALKRVVADLRTGGPPDFATLSVALQAVRRLSDESRGNSRAR